MDVKEITTLDNKTWNKQDLLTEMANDKFYYDYLGANALSSSSIKKLLDSPKAYEDSLIRTSGKIVPAFEFGWLFHTAILEPHVYEKQHFVDIKSRNTNVFKEALSEHGRVFTYKERDEVERLAEAFYNNSMAMELMENTKKEVPAIENLFDIPFRGKADVLGDGYIIDLKTTGNINKFEYSAREYKYGCQAYIYCKLFNVDYRDFTFIAIDKTTATIGFYGISERSYYDGERDVEQAVMIYNEFFVNKNRDVFDYQIEGEI